MDVSIGDTGETLRFSRAGPNTYVERFGKGGVPTGPPRVIPESVRQFLFALEDEPGSGARLWQIIARLIDVTERLEKLSSNPET